MDKNNKKMDDKKLRKKFSMRTMKQKNGKPYPRVLALMPMNSGFGYAVFECPNRIIDCGVTSIRVNRVARSRVRFEKLLKEYQPRQIVCMDTGRDPKTVAQKVTTSVKSHCEQESLPFELYRRSIIKGALGAVIGVITRYDLVEHLVDWLPTLESIRPQRKAIWEAEDPRMKIFDAAALGVVFYAIYNDRVGDNKLKNNYEKQTEGDQKS